LDAGENYPVAHSLKNSENYKLLLQQQASLANRSERPVAYGDRVAHLLNARMHDCIRVSAISPQGSASEMRAEFIYQPRPEELKLQTQGRVITETRDS
jgi:hypothetical protein